MRITGVVLTAFALTAGLAAQQRPAPRPQATFRGGVTYVEVDAYVTNAHDDPVADLTANDFELIDAGSPQRITTFAAVNLPIARGGGPLPAAAGSIQQGARTNLTPEGRIYLVVLDDLHVDGTRTPAVRTALRRFVEQDLGPTDMTAIVSTSGRPDASAEFTTDRRLLIDVIDRFLGQKLPSATLGQIQAARDERFQEGFKGIPEEGGYAARLWSRFQCAGARVSRAEDHGHATPAVGLHGGRHGAPESDGAGIGRGGRPGQSDEGRAPGRHRNTTVSSPRSSPKRRPRSVPRPAATSPSMPSTLAGSPTPLPI